MIEEIDKNIKMKKKFKAAGYIITGLVGIAVGVAVDAWKRRNDVRDAVAKATSKVSAEFGEKFRDLQSKLNTVLNGFGEQYHGNSVEC